MTRFLSSEWFEAAHAATATPLDEDQPDPAATVVLEQVVEGGPDGTVVYRVHARPGGATIEWPVPDVAPAADLRITSDWETASAIASGSLSTQQALALGRLKLSGHPAGLSERVEAIAGVDPVDPGLRRATRFAAS